MAATTQTEEQVSLNLKLVVNKETNKVLFAEAGKDFVDVLCSFLTLPLGTIARLVQKESKTGPVTVGCLNSLYKGVENLDRECLWKATCKEMLLQPKNSSEDYCRSLKLNIDDTQPIKYFICSKFVECFYPSLSISTNGKCQCGNLIDCSVFLKKFCEGFVNAAVTFIITDDLIVLPNTVDHTIFALFQKFGLQSISSVKEMTMNVTKEKVLDLLKYSLLSKSTLTDLFLGNKPLLERSRFSPCSVANSSIQMKLKLVIRKSDGKILYAQGDQHFADFLISILTLPLGGVVRNLGGDSSLGCIDALYKCIADLNENLYLTSKEVKSRLVNPPRALEFRLSKQILPIPDPTRDLQYYCYYQGSSLRESIVHNQFFITDKYMSELGKKYRCISPVSSTGSHNEGFVKGPGMYMATDDLVVAPMSPISAINLLNSLEIPLSDLKEEIVTIGVNECFSILKASLTTTSALTNGLGHLLNKVKEEK